MNKLSLTTFIQKHSASSSKETIENIVSHFEERILSSNNYFLKDGKISNEYMFLENGFLRAFTFDIDGNEVTTNFYSGNDVVFEVSSFFNRTISKENIQALTDCKGYVITYDQLNRLFHSIPEFRDFGRAMLVKGFVALKQRTLSFINETAEERYIHLMQTDTEIFQHAPLKYIASYLGITDTSLSRIRKEYAKK